MTPTEEALTAGSALSRRLFGWRRFGFFIYIALVAAVAAAWIALLDVVGVGLVSSVGVVASMLLMHHGYVRWCGGLGRDSWSRMGAPPEGEVSYDIGEAGLEIGNGSGMVTTLPWSAVLGVYREKTFWLLITMNGGGFYLPRRFFSSVEAETAFGAYCLERISPQALARSPEAAAFVAQAS